ncbi:Acetylornithine deacetylase/Succinyl-diaminopimelate desuccinylase [Lampropedia hyalina DSM 16112]|jgi:acetylornithine deacetylase/succinyl-diaminopimelate desuccinylase-like protein|uniref:Acetylornithine deacetylase/Succinyl-diaminopimelate desuccinylase n=1 Tax=Lampropedia hyalina DSM 16112 TaxID=1122156 RepID=A0A1M4YP12_9BURK|nr:M20/M25/M40 family metallo-hydrolase [Lampropedia hyalina]SHF07377.1 Acetylornithine deacetylase/Succinyl-diaminopimelate desuccinylase [Lampropedia hyalina DSM 16112]
MTLPQPTAPDLHARLDAWVDAHFDEEIAFLQQLIRVPTDTPPGDNAPHAEKTAALLAQWGLEAQPLPVPPPIVRAGGMQSITNLIVRRAYGQPGADGQAHPVIALNAHGDVVPPGEGWTHDPYGGECVGGRIYGRAAAVSKSDFATYTFALRALEAVARPGRGQLELHFTYDEEFGGELGPGWLLQQGHTRPDWLVAAGFAHEVVTAHNGCLQLEVTVHGKMAHAAIPDTGVDALQAAHRLLAQLYAQNAQYRAIRSEVDGIGHPYLNVGRIEGGTHTNVVPGKVVFRLDRRMIPEEDPTTVEADIRGLITATAASIPGVTVDIQRLLLARAMRPLPGSQPLVEAIQRHGQELLGHPVAARGTPLYTDVRLYAEQGIPGVIYGAGPRTVLESNAKRADEHLELQDLRNATKVVARVLADLFQTLPG